MNKSERLFDIYKTLLSKGSMEIDLIKIKYSVCEKTVNRDFRQLKKIFGEDISFDQNAISIK